MIVERPIPKEVAHLLSDCHPVLARVYAARGITKSEELERDLQYLLSYKKLLGIDDAVDCLYQALQQQQAILIVGDYDADGATSTALVVSALKAMGARKVDYLVPNRFTYGYGLTPAIVAVAAERSPTPQLIITVDNGIASVEGVAAAKARNIKVLITDHHLPGHTLPVADAIVNPNQPNDSFPSKHLAGVGVIFYVMLALRAHLREVKWFTQHQIPEPNMGHYLDLVALGTVADVVPLDKNNRILVHQGLQRIRAGKSRLGINALLAIAKRIPRRITSSDLGFALGPRLNAAGRMDDMSIGIACLLSEEGVRAHQLATQLDGLNRQRRAVEESMQQQAWEALEKLDLPQSPDKVMGLCLFHDTWHQGVIGIVAGRIKERFHRPVIAFATGEDNLLKGSARSVEGVHIRDALDAIATRYPGMITKFGGHAMAAGLSLLKTQLAAFTKAFDAEIRRWLRPEDLQGQVVTDGGLEVMDYTLTVAQDLRRGGPWGQGFPEPLFRGRFTLVEQRLVGTQHLKMCLACEETGTLLDAIAFFVDVEQWPDHQCQAIEAAFRLDVNEYQGVERLQLLVEYFEKV
ncbi:MAG: single-stranded-DNA-specific exonuclease RecJ [Gammaproteobacteria bacterium]